jgi:hypothetical protein
MDDLAGPDDTTATRAGLPESGPRPLAPFLLDAGYEGMLDSGAFRQRFARLHARLVDQVMGFGCAIALLPVALLPLIIFFFTRDNDYIMASASIATVVIPLCAVWLWFWSGSLGTYLRLRRLALEGELVQGKLLAAKRIRESVGDAEDGFIVAVEVEYRAATSAGVRVEGKKTQRRDDLLNAELPEPGTPVYVLVLDAATHALL